MSLPIPAKLPPSYGKAPRHTGTPQFGFAAAPNASRFHCIGRTRQGFRNANEKGSAAIQFLPPTDVKGLSERQRAAPDTPPAGGETPLPDVPPRLPIPRPPTALENQQSPPPRQPVGTTRRRRTGCIGEARARSPNVRDFARRRPENSFHPIAAPSLFLPNIAKYPAARRKATDGFDCPAADACPRARQRRFPAINASKPFPPDPPHDAPSR